MHSCRHVGPRGWRGDLWEFRHASLDGRLSYLKLLDRLEDLLWRQVHDWTWHEAGVTRVIDGNISLYFLGRCFERHLQPMLLFLFNLSDDLVDVPALRSHLADFVFQTWVLLVHHIHHFDIMVAILIRCELTVSSFDLLLFLLESIKELRTRVVIDWCRRE